MEEDVGSTFAFHRIRLRGRAAKDIAIAIDLIGQPAFYESRTLKPQSFVPGTVVDVEFEYILQADIGEIFLPR